MSQGLLITDHADVIDQLRAMQERVRSIRTRHCEPKANTNPRYLALSNVLANLGKAIEDMGRAPVTRGPSPLKSPAAWCRKSCRFAAK